ncbi:ceramide glucosyltransferase [Burkholderia singularis]|uniref:Ceramide glucosyltransferase n=1 Tax=Burkholderia singularis TaxID=1503053 RepID=A0A103DZ23_9BURK|nr:bacteriohopanetetrol glucosamine biosynthesis glycosyltransferase HpnI [Burkholderia singularis]KVE25364.1 ceramide glucosyltransferase [Burkholderia singularis]SMG03130.1 Ceramide glucosyltransferase [Burkholderia singularis]
MTEPVSFVEWVLLALICAACAYAAFAAFAPAPRVPRTAARDGFEPVSVLKPLCGFEPHLYENLATFCEQRHPRYQLLFGVASAADPAVAVVRRLIAAYPETDIELVIDARVYGKNLKVSNLVNLAERARYGRIVIADSDIAVEPDYLTRVSAPLADPSVGVVTCLYHARSVGGFWARIGAQFVDAWFAPSVRITHFGGSSRFGFGATLALTRATLDKIGGFHALKDELADDYWLAELPRRFGLRTVLSEVIVATDVTEAKVVPLWLRETRWLRTIRSLNPAGFAFLFITFTAPWLATGAWLAVRLNGSAAGVAAAAAVALGTFARLALHARGSAGVRAFWRDLPLVPVRDALLALEWLAAVFGTQVVWRGERMEVVGGGARATVVEAGDGR